MFFVLLRAYQRAHNRHRTRRRRPYNRHKIILANGWE